METIITISVFITELITMLVLGFVVLAACSVLYDHLKKNISIEKQVKTEKDNPDIYGWEKGFGGKEK